MLGLTTPDSIELGVAIGTGLLAIATFVLAFSTKRMADSSADQLRELRRHADAAEATVEQAFRVKAEALHYSTAWRLPSGGHRGPSAAASA